jgi:hypothetical protein
MTVGRCNPGSQGSPRTRLRSLDHSPADFPPNPELCPFLRGEWMAGPAGSVRDRGAPAKSRGADTGGHAPRAPPAHLSWAWPRDPAPPSPALIGRGGALC